MVSGENVGNGIGGLELVDKDTRVVTIPLEEVVLVLAGGAGGGGAGIVGSNGSAKGVAGHTGGTGVASSITGSSVTRGGMWWRTGCF